MRVRKALAVVEGISDPRAAGLGVAGVHVLDEVLGTVWAQSLRQRLGGNRG